MAMTPPLNPNETPVDVYREDSVTPLENRTPQQAYTTKKVIFRTYQIIWYILGLIEALLAFRLLLRLVGANPNSGFAELIYAISAPFALPFQGVVRPSAFGASVMEWSTVIAMLVYLIIAYGLVKLFKLIKPTDPIEVERGVDQ